MSASPSAAVAKSEADSTAASVSASSSAVPAGVASPTTSQLRSQKIGRDFREGVGDLTGLSSRSPPVNVAESKTASLSAMVQASSTTTYAGIERCFSATVAVAAVARAASRGSRASASRRCPLAILRRLFWREQKRSGPGMGTQIDALTQGFQETSINDVLSSSLDTSNSTA